jgi:phosphoribosylaminoimidazolecarboxamide formyltransferase/IMP cyclohydrolase
LLEAWTKSLRSDTVSIFGGIEALNRTVTADVADQMKEIFLEVIVAPDYAADALEILQKKKNLRLLKLPAVAEPIAAGEQMIKHVYGGLLVQDQDTQVLPEAGYTVVTEAQPSDDDKEDLVFAMKVVKHVKSNAIVLVKNRQTVGIGPGQPTGSHRPDCHCQCRGESQRIHSRLGCFLPLCRYSPGRSRCRHCSHHPAWRIDA